jgi:hypothetical protein
MNKTVVSIVATNYSGSHYLALLLGSHSRAAHIGEVWHFSKRRPTAPLCLLCGDTASCPLFRGVDPRRLDELYQRIFANVPDVEALIDNSKLLSWARRWLDDDRYQKKYVFMVRDPRALVRRWDRRHASWRSKVNQRYSTLRRRPWAASEILFGGRKGVYVHKWLTFNRWIHRFLVRRGLDFEVVTYRDLCRDPAAELERLMPWIGLPFEPAQIDYWNVEHHGKQKQEYRWVAEQQTRHFDLRWQEDLGAAEREWIAGHPQVRAWLDEHGLGIEPDGLTRVGS